MSDFMDNKSKALSRREILKIGALGAAAGLISPVIVRSANAASLVMPKVGSFNVSFRNQHTGESFNGAYRVGDRYLPDAFEKINYVLRDFRQNEVFPIDPRLMDVLYRLQLETGTKEGFEILSGYRSSKTNGMLRSSTAGVAKNSLHTTGQAVDIRLPGYSTYNLKKIAAGFKVGGVGYYSKSNFVHLDTGKVRTW